MKSTRVRLGAEIALTVALAAVLNLLRFPSLPQGGSVSLVMLPLFVLALLRGPAAGVVAGALYGMVDLMMEPVIFHPIQVALDYPLAFAACGLAGVFALRWARLHREGHTLEGLWSAALPGVALGALGRYAFHVLSGVVYFASYAPAGEAPFIYSLVYNTFVFVSATVCAVILVAVLPPLETYLTMSSR